MQPSTTRGDGLADTASPDGLSAFQDLISRRVEDDGLRFVDDVRHNVPIFDAVRIRGLCRSPDGSNKVLEEFARVLSAGAGVFVIAGAFADTDIIDRATIAFREMIAAEAASHSQSDHFAAAGANDRVWNALEKLCVSYPDVFAGYYANDMIALACTSWLGPWYQMTSQINVVRPGGDAQQPHCDYHLGFQTAEDAARFPDHVHALSRVLTLQGAVAHCDMPVESGPTMVLPYSQCFERGYLSWREPAFVA